MLIFLIRGMRGRIQLVLHIPQEFNLPSERVKFPHELYAVNCLFDKMASGVVLPFFVVGVTLRSDCTSIVEIASIADSQSQRLHQWKIRRIPAALDYRCEWFVL